MPYANAVVNCIILAATIHLLQQQYDMIRLQFERFDAASDRITLRRCLMDQFLNVKPVDLIGQQTADDGYGSIDLPTAQPRNKGDLSSQLT